MEILPFDKVKILFRNYNIPLIDTHIVSNLREAKEKAKRFGYPLVLKVDSPQIFHKTEKGLVRVCYQEKDLHESFNFLLKKRAGKILIQKMGEGYELIIGMKRDEIFGSVVLVGMGGIFAEVFKDVSFGFCPLNQKKAVEMIKELKFYRVLAGYRGKERVDVLKLARVLVSVSKMAQEHSEIEQIDLNPVFAHGKIIKTVDAKVFVKNI